MLNYKEKSSEKIVNIEIPIIKCAGQISLPKKKKKKKDWMQLEY